MINTEDKCSEALQISRTLQGRNDKLCSMCVLSVPYAGTIECLGRYSCTIWYRAHALEMLHRLGRLQAWHI
jgi:hypothetical protein